MGWIIKKITLTINQWDIYQLMKYIVDNSIKRTENFYV
jgi:hypothetical protein